MYLRAWTYSSVLHGHEAVRRFMADGSYDLAVLCAVHAS